MSLKLKNMGAWFGILLSYCVIAGVALGINSGANDGVLQGTLGLGFIAVNFVGLLLSLRKKGGETIGRGGWAGSGFRGGLALGAFIAGVIWLLGP